MMINLVKKLTDEEVEQMMKEVDLDSDGQVNQAQMIYEVKISYNTL